ncbi:MAG: hypothetical protein DRP74_01890 [Candidatus Omnitrophota bacterium]|nr:MAG: hypothetical protein DRP74_01890 [Candidatus Omnitrophota bacterium]
MKLPKKYTLISIIITIIALSVAFRDVKINYIFDYIRKGRYLYMVPAFLFLCLYCFLRAIRWGVFFTKKISLKGLFAATMVGFMANNIFPARAGEFLKAYMLGRSQSVSKSTCFATVILERLWDGLTLVFFMGCIFLLSTFSGGFNLGYKSQYGSLKFASVIFILFYAVAFFFIINWEKYFQKINGVLTKILKIFSVKFAEHFSFRLVKFSEGLAVFKDHRKIIVSIILSIAIWVSAALTIYFMLKAFSMNLSFLAPFVLLIFIALFVMLPSWGTLGTMQMGFIFGLGLFGISKPEALSFSFVYQFFDTVPVIIVGLVYFWRFGLAFDKLLKIEDG